MLHLLGGRENFLTFRMISFYYYLEQVKIIPSRLSSDDFSAIFMGEDFETPLTTSRRTSNTQGI